ncbi:MAG TPA: STAS/SEC14 domain-containing protein [Patescibacteria group bacterium]|nr:STAS/SEC14 domain-containing protein [Patescibacteria group bacterium]
MSAGAPDLYFDLPGVATVRWDPATVTVVVEWAGLADATEFTALLDAEIRALRDHDATRLLADCRLQKVLNAGAEDWADREWLPRAIGAGLRRFAVVLPESEAAAGNVRRHLGHVPSKTLEVGYFETVEAARAWLSEG